MMAESPDVEQIDWATFRAGFAAGVLVSAVILVALLCAACGSSSPTAPAPPTPAPTPTPTPTPPMVATIQIQTCPAVMPGVDISFYTELACNGFESPAALQPAKRWTVAPNIYLKTIDEAGAPIDAVTLDTVQQAMVSAAPQWTGGKFTINVTRGTESREGVSGWITVKWPATAQTFCGNSTVAIDGGFIVLNNKSGTGCSCNGSAIRPRTAAHELGHSFGYWHTDNPDDLMSNLPNQTKPCDQQPSGRELAAAAAHYR